MAVAQILNAKGRDVFTAGPVTKVADVAKILSEKRIGAVVITGADGHIEGIVSERDVVRHIGQEGGAVLTRPVSEIMTRNVFTCREGDSEQDLMTLMTKNRIRHLPVVNAGKLVGMISIGDVVKHRMEAMEHEAEDLKNYIANAG